MLNNTKKLINALYKANYQLIYQPDSTDYDYQRTEEMILLIGKNCSKFQSKGMFLKDSIIHTLRTNNIVDIGIWNSMRKNIPGTKFLGKIF